MSQPSLPIRRFEFIALAAALMAANALAIDIMLPAMQQIGESLGVVDPNHRQFVVGVYMAGFGIGQLAFGPISDRFGRRAPLLAGLGIYVAAAFGAALAPTFPILLAWRALQGIGAAATRVIGVSLVRDVYVGRRMAEVMSLVMMVFMLVPILAPGLGQIVMTVFGEWHAIFVFMGLIGLAVTVWGALRLPETLPESARRPFEPKVIAQGFRAVLSHRRSIGYTLASTAVFGGFFGFINSAQQIYVDIYGLGELFPLFFAGGAGVMALSNFMNSRLVGRFGMRRLSHGALVILIAVSAILLLLSLMGPVPLPVFLLLFALAMAQYGCIGANFGAMAMEPVGHVAGTASSTQGFLQTVGGGLLGALVGQAFDGTVTPLAAGFTGFAGVALVLVLYAEKGKLFGHGEAAPAVDAASPETLGPGTDVV